MHMLMMMLYKYILYNDETIIAKIKKYMVLYLYQSILLILLTLASSPKSPTAVTYTYGFSRAVQE